MTLSDTVIATFNPTPTITSYCDNISCVIVSVITFSLVVDALLRSIYIVVYFWPPLLLLIL